MSLNQVNLIGRLTRNPELRYLPSNTPVVGFGLAINRKWRDRVTSEQKEETTFVDVSAFGRTAETINQYFHKGDQIFVSGRLRLEQWKQADGTQRSKVSVVCEQFEFVGSRDRVADAPPATPTPQSRPVTTPAAPEEDLPF